MESVLQEHYPVTMPEIDTLRLRLRMFRPDDQEALARIICDPQVMKYYGPGLPVSPGEVESILRGMLRAWKQPGFGRWAVMHKGGRELIGVCGFRWLEQAPELSYALAKANWGMGLATEAAAACLKYGFEELQFTDVVAVVRRENMASQRVLEKIGMANQREARYGNVDVLRYEITQGEYQQIARHRLRR